MDPRKQFDELRGSAHARGYGRRWRKLRKMVLARDPLCKIQELCGPRAGQPFPAPSRVADHIVPRARGGEDTMENLRGCCKACHDWKTATQDSGFAERRGRGLTSPRIDAPQTARRP